jgi:ferric iron reductase protein FhuF
VNPYFALETPPSLDGWTSLDELLTAAALRTRVRETHAALGDGPVRAAASVDSLGVFARLVSPVLAALTVDGRAPQLSPATVWWQRAVPGPMRLAVTASQSTTSLADAVIAPVIVPLVDLYASTFALSRKVLWGNLASALNGAALQLGRGRTAYRRGTCCLMYRFGAGNVCGDCVLTRTGSPRP